MFILFALLEKEVFNSTDFTNPGTSKSPRFSVGEIFFHLCKTCNLLSKVGALNCALEKLKTSKKLSIGKVSISESSSILLILESLKNCLRILCLVSFILVVFTLIKT